MYYADEASEKEDLDEWKVLHQFKVYAAFFHHSLIVKLCYSVLRIFHVIFVSRLSSPVLYIVLGEKAFLFYY